MIIPYFWSLNQGYKYHIFPVFAAKSFFFADIKYFGKVTEWYNRGLFFHFSCHHNKLHKIFYIIFTAWTKCLILISIVKARKVVAKRLFFKIKELTLLYLCFFIIWAAHWNSIIHTIFKSFLDTLIILLKRLI